MKRILALLGVLLVAGLLVGLMASLWNRSAGFLAHTWQNEVEQAPDDRVDEVLQRLCALGETAIPALAEALNSDRPTVGRAAEHALWAEIARWESLGNPERLGRGALLADALADRWEHYGPRARRHAAAMLLHLLSRPLPMGAERRDALLAACARVLRAGDALSAAMAGRADGADVAAGAVGAIPAVDGADGSAGWRSHGSLSSDHAPASLELPKLPGGGIPLEMALDGYASGGSMSASGRVDSEGTLGRPLAATDPADPLPNPLRWPAPGPLPLTGSGDVAGGPPSASNEAMRLSAVGALAGQSDAKGPEATPDEGEDLRALARRLHSDDARAAAAARSALLHRGFGEREISLARALADPDPDARKDLARGLPDIPGVDAAAWLWELSHDAEAQVRLEAITLLATTNDPAWLPRLRQLAQSDPDPRIQRLADRLVAPRSATAGRSGTRVAR